MLTFVYFYSFINGSFFMIMMDSGSHPRARAVVVAAVVRCSCCCGSARAVSSVSETPGAGICGVSRPVACLRPRRAPPLRVMLMMMKETGWRTGASLEVLTALCGTGSSSRWRVWWFRPPRAAAMRVMVRGIYLARPHSALSSSSASYSTCSPRFSRPDRLARLPCARCTRSASSRRPRAPLRSPPPASRLLSPSLRAPPSQTLYQFPWMDWKSDGVMKW